MIDALEEYSTSFNTRVDNANIDFIYAITAFVESYSNEDLYVEKKVQQSLMVRIKNFFAELIAAMRHFIDSTSIEIDKKVRSAEWDKKLRQLHRDLHEQKKQGVTTVRVPDVWAQRDKYLYVVNDLKKIAKRFSNGKYTHIKQIDEDIEKYNSTMAEYKDELEEVSKKTIEVNIDKMLEFIEDEVSGRGEIMSSLNDAVALLQQMQKDCELLEKKEMLYGPDLVAKHAGALRQMGTGISKFIKKWSVKIISTAIIIIGS